MTQMLRPVMLASYFLGLLVLVIAALLKATAMVGSPIGFEAANWGIGACALFLCVLASARMLEMPKR